MHDPDLNSPSIQLAHDRWVALRMADANFNRVMEGLRTLEDVARYSDRQALQAAYKGIRHELQRTVAVLPREESLAARDADGDVGRTEKQPSELNRSQGLSAIVASAAGRSEQGLRVLEEVAKFLAPESGLNFERLRYQIYDLNARLQLDLHRQVSFLNRSKLYVLVDCSFPIETFLQRLLAISQAGAELIQIRDKEADARTLLKYARASIDHLNFNHTRLILNDRPDLARSAKVWGVHVGQEDMDVVSTRRCLESNQIVGLSTHDLDQVRDAKRVGADYIGCGPTFPSATKSFDRFAGTQFLRSVADFLKENNMDIPAYAIGGIGAENVPFVRDAGFSRVAVGSAIWRSERPGHETEAVRRTLD